MSSNSFIKADTQSMTQANIPLSPMISNAIIPNTDKHMSGYITEREAFINGRIRPALESSGEYTQEQIEQRLATARQNLDTQILKNANAGATQKGNPRDYVKLSKKEEATNQVSKGFFESILGYIGGMFGEAGGLLMSVIIKPLFGDKISNWLSDTFSGKTPEQREKEQTAAGIVDGARQTVNIEGQNFALSDGAAAGLYTRLTVNPPVAVTPASPSPAQAEPNPQTAAAAAEAAEAARRAGTSGANQSAPSGAPPAGSVPPTPAVATAAGGKPR